MVQNMWQNNALRVAALFVLVAVTMGQEFLMAENNMTQGQIKIMNLGGRKNPGLLLLSTNGTITDHIEGEARRFARKNYTVAVMDVFSAEFPSMASLSGTDNMPHYAAQILNGLNFLNHSNFTAWVDSDKLGIIGWGWGATGVLAAADHDAVVFHAGVAFTPHTNQSDRPINITTDTSLLISIDYDHVAHLAQLEFELDAGEVEWDINVIGGTSMHFNVEGHDDYHEDASRRTLVTTFAFLENTFEMEYGSDEPDYPVEDPLVHLPTGYDVEGGRNPGALIYDKCKATELTKKPAVVIVPAWGGYTEYELKRQAQFAAAGFVTMSANIYGLPIGYTIVDDENHTIKRANASVYREEGNEIKGEKFSDAIEAAVDAVTALEFVDDDAVAAVGFCFGGTGVNNLFRYSADVQVGVSMHGNMMQTRDFTAFDDTMMASVKADGGGEYLLMVSGGVDGGEEGKFLIEHLDQLTKMGYGFEVMRFSGVDHGFSEWGGWRYNARAEGAGTTATLDVFAKQFGMATMDVGCTEEDVEDCPEIPVNMKGMEECPPIVTTTEAEEVASEMTTDPTDPNTEVTTVAMVMDTTATPPPQEEMTTPEPGPAITCATWEQVDKCIMDANIDENVPTCGEIDMVKEAIAHCVAQAGCCDDWAVFTGAAPAGDCNFGACDLIEFAKMDKVVMTVTLPMTEAEFTADKQESYKKAIAKAAGVPILQVNILGFKEVRRRRMLLAGSLEVETEIATASKALADSLASGTGLDLDTLNTALLEELDVEATGVTEPTVTAAPSVTPIDSGAAYTAPSVAVAVASLAMALMAV